MSGQAFVQFLGFFAATMAVASVIGCLVDHHVAAWRLSHRPDMIDD
jgi:hypothetical protein